MKRAQVSMTSLIHAGGQQNAESLVAPVNYRVGSVFYGLDDKARPREQAICNTHTVMQHPQRLKEKIYSNIFTIPQNPPPPWVSMVTKRRHILRSAPNRPSSLAGGSSKQTSAMSSSRSAAAAAAAAEEQGTAAGQAASCVAILMQHPTNALTMKRAGGLKELAELIFDSEHSEACMCLLSSWSSPPLLSQF